MNSVVLTIAGIIVDGGLERLGRMLGNRLIVGDGVGIIGPGEVCCGSDGCGTNFGWPVPFDFFAMLF